MPSRIYKLNCLTKEVLKYFILFYLGKNAKSIGFCVI